MKTIAKISEETLAIINYLESIAHGQILSYAEIETNTGVKMDNTGKSYLRSACRKLRREYSAIHGIGIELASAKTATGIVVTRLVRIDKAVKRAEKTVNNVTVDFYDQFSPQEQKQINFLGAVFGAIRVSAQNGKHYLKNASTIHANPMLPENIK